MDHFVYEKKYEFYHENWPAYLTIISVIGKHSNLAKFCVVISLESSVTRWVNIHEELVTNFAKKETQIFGKLFGLL